MITEYESYLIQLVKDRDATISTQMVVIQRLREELAKSHNECAWLQRVSDTTKEELRECLIHKMYDS